MQYFDSLKVVQCEVVQCALLLATFIDN